MNGEASVKPVLIHFGCGNLGLGAVLPFLIHHYGMTHKIIAFQRRTGKWATIPDKIILPIKTSAGDFMPFHVVFMKQGESPSMLSCSADRVLVLGSDLLQDGLALLNQDELLKINQPIISCSLAAGQDKLVDLLKISNYWERALVFENTAKDGWKDKSLEGRWHHIITDRICIRIKPYDQRDHPYVLSQCEIANKDKTNISFAWPVAANIPIIDRTPPCSQGEIVVLSWSTRSFADDELSWQQFRKRALVNSLHAITAMLCYRMLAEKEMDPANQYVAPLQQMLRVAHPEWVIATDHYIRLRAIQVAWKKQLPKIDKETFHVFFWDAYTKAREAEKRFFDTSDLLSRLMNNMKKEIEKFKEHVVDPLAFYSTNRDAIEENWIYGHPSRIDMDVLRDFLTETFLEAGKWMMTNQKDRPEN